MPRIRTVKPEFWTSEQVVECSPTSRLLFIGMWNFSDDNGIHPVSCKTLKMQIFPGDNFTPEDISRMIDELKKASLLIEYTVNSKKYWQVTGWHHQKIDKPNFRYPLPDHSTSGSRTAVEHLPAEGSGEESKGKEGNGSDARSDFQKVFDHGVDLLPQLAVKNPSSITKWLAAGADVNLDIIPTVARLASKQPSSWNYFDRAVMDAKATRETPLPVGNAKAASKRSARPSTNPNIMQMSEEERYAKGFA
jgi:hypothetical protein